MRHPCLRRSRERSIAINRLKPFPWRASGFRPLSSLRVVTHTVAVDVSLTIELLGPMRVLVDGEPMPSVRSRKALWLLALLALRGGRSVTREWLAGALWPDASGAVGLANLRPVISELRRALGSQAGRLRASDRNALDLDLEGAEVDVVDFDAAVGRGDRARTVELYRGGLLEGCLEGWAIQERRIREAACFAALQGLGDAALREGRPAEAAALFTRAIGIEPLQDAPRRGLMTALAAMGDVNAALQTYREFASLLSSEVGAAPDRETARLYERLRADLRQPPKKKAAAPTPNNLAPPPNALIGREDEGADVADRLRRTRLVTLSGAGGIGKTRLAVSVATATLTEYPGGVWFVALDALRDGRGVVVAVAAELGVRAEPKRPLLECIVGRLCEGRCMLVLDNCEHLLDDAAELVARLLRECPELRIMATSREPMGLPGEGLWPVSPLAFPTEAHLPARSTTRRRVAEAFESVRLFVERAKEVQPTFELDDENLESVIDVCAQVEGLPLAIELAAARVRSMAMKTLQERLRERRLETLQGRAAGPIHRQRALRTTLDWSYALLDDEERRAMARLAVFVGGWTLEAAESVCGAKETADRLRSLVEKSIVVFDGRVGRYRFLETVREYAAEKLMESGETDRVHTDHREWCLAFAERAEPGLQGADQAQWLRLTDVEWPNLRKALDQGDRHPAFGLRLAKALWFYWYVRGAREGRRSLEEALSREGVDDPLARGEALYGLACMNYSEGAYEASRAALNECLVLFHALGDKRNVARTLGILGNVASAVDGHERAMAHYEESLVTFREIGDRSSIARTLYNLATLIAQHGQFPRARALFEEGLAVARDLGSDRLIAWSLIGLSSVALRQGDHASQNVLEDEALERFGALGEKRGIAWVLCDQGAQKRNQGDPGAALLKLEESRRLFREIGDRRNEANAAVVASLATFDAGGLDAAEALLNESIETLRELDDHLCLADGLLALGMVLDEKGDATRAWDCHKESLALRIEIDDPMGVADSLDRIAERAVNLGADDHSAYLFGASEALREAIGIPRDDADEPRYQRRRDLARTRLGDFRFDGAAAAGRATPWRDAASRALEPIT